MAYDNNGNMSTMDATRSYVTARTAASASVANGGHSVGGGSIAPPPGAMAQPQPAPYPSFVKFCGCTEVYLPGREVLEYDYTYDDVSGKKPPQSYPRIRERGEFYIDSFNGEPWSCSFGTAEKVRTRKPWTLIGWMDGSMDGWRNDAIRVSCRRSSMLIFVVSSPMMSFVLLFASIYRTEPGSIPPIKPDPSCPLWFGYSCSIHRSPSHYLQLRRVFPSPVA